MGQKRGWAGDIKEHHSEDRESTTKRSRATSIAKNMSKPPSQESVCSNPHGAKKMDLRKTRQCCSLLKKLMNHKFGWLFNEPVDPVKLEIPDYFSIISNPMDLGTIKHKLESKQYEGTHQFEADMRLTFSNAMRYNPPGNIVHDVAAKLSSSFNASWTFLERKWENGDVHADQLVATRRDEQGITSLLTCHEKQSAQPNVCSSKLLTELQKIKPNKDLERFQGIVPARPAHFPWNQEITEISKKTKTIVVDSNNQKPFLELEHADARSFRPADVGIKCNQGFVDVSSKGLTPRCSKDHQAHPSCCSPTASPHQASPLLSPNRALRAAMLKSRFAGTIVKAQLLDQGEQIDLEKFEKEKVKLQKMQQKEKARIQARIKAAEGAAQMKIEAKIRKREKEREAARSALQEVKRTVYIDNLEILKDVEELSQSQMRFCGSPLTVLNFADGCPLLRGSGSPLEQLGLFMKNDDFGENPDDDDELLSSESNGYIQ